MLQQSVCDCSELCVSGWAGVCLGGGDHLQEPADQTAVRPEDPGGRLQSDQRHDERGSHLRQGRRTTLDH